MPSDSQLESNINWNQSQGTMGSVPGGQVPQDILTGLTQRSAQINEELLKALPAALKQTAQASSPAVALPSVTPFQPRQQDQRELVGAGANYRQSVSNSIKSIGNIVGQMEQKHQENQIKTLSIDIQRIMEAQDGISQAKQILQQDPNNADAKAAIQKNSDIINATLSDPKKRKQIGKAFDINFVDPSKNDKPEHKALQDAAKSYAEQLQAKVPQKMGPDPQAVAKVQLLTQQAQAIDKMVQATEQTIYRQEYLKHLQDAEQGRNQRAADSLEFRKQQEANREALRQEEIQAGWNKAKLSADTRLKVASINANARLTGIDRQIQGRIDAIDKVFKSGGELKKIQALTNVDKMYQSKQKALADEINKAKQNRDTANDAMKQEFNQYINTLEKEQQQNEDEQKQLQDQIQVLTDSLGDSDAGDSSNNTESKSTSRRSESSSSTVTIPKPVKSARQYDGSDATAAVKVAGPTGDSDPDHF